MLRSGDLRWGFSTEAPGGFFGGVRVQSDLKKQTGEGERPATCNSQFEGKDRKALLRSLKERKTTKMQAQSVKGKSRFVKFVSNIEYRETKNPATESWNQKRLRSCEEA